MGANITGETVNLTSIERLLERLQAANECKAAASLDVRDATKNRDFYQRKLEAMRERHLDACAVCEAICEELSDAVEQITVSPVMLTAEAIDDASR